MARARYPLEGPARSLAAFEQAIAFCEKRGLANAGTAMEADCPGLLVELGRPEEALERAHRLALTLETRGETQLLAWVRSLELATEVARGETATAGRSDWLLESMRTVAYVAVAVEGGAAAAAARLAAGLPEQACALLAELEQTPGARETSYYARQLAPMLRTALAAGDAALAQRLAGGLDPRYPLREHALCAARAMLAEHGGDHADAATLYGEAADRWHEFGNVPERAHALLGQGRCLLALGRPEAEKPLIQAKELFSTIGYRPALAQTEALLEQIVSAPDG